MEIPEHKNPHEKPFREQMMKKNCWEFKNCGRQNGGSKVREFGICPVATDSSHQGKNGGLNSGRYCWKVAGTLCGGKVQGSFAAKVANCLACDFFQLVRQEEGKALIL